MPASGGRPSLGVVLGLVTGCTLHPEGSPVAAGGASSSSSTSSTGAAVGGATSGSGGLGGMGGLAGSGGQAGEPAMPACGDGNVDDGEQCDDTNANSGDGCSSDCQVECSAGNEHLEPASLHCYAVHTTATSGHAALSTCKALGPGWDLAAVTPMDEIAIVEAFLPDTHFFWIGGNDLDVEGSFAWSNGEPWIYENGQLPWFSPGEPNNYMGNENCVRTLVQGTFNDGNCDESAAGAVDIGFLCERPPAGGT